MIVAQVKVNGYRIELGEIEASLAMSSSVEQAVAVVRRGQLVAYLKPARETTLTTQVIDDVRAALARKLPIYMIPE